MDWGGLWRLMLPTGPSAPSAAEQRPILDGPADPVDAAGPEDGAVPPRFLFVVARTRLDLFLTIRRRFLDDRTVHVLLDRREQERRWKPSPVYVPERRRQAERRRPRDYWENTAHHPAVLIPLSRRRQDASDIDTRPSAEAPEHDKEPTMEHVLVDQARLLAWVQESQHVLQHVIPTVLDERDALGRQLLDATRRCQELQEENDGLRAEVTRATAAHQQLEQGHADIVGSVGQFLAQMTNVLGPMRELAEKLGQAGPRRDGADPAG
jgi:hypothetical protein